MRVLINIDLDLDGHHTFTWKPSDAPGAIDVPKSTLERWITELEASRVADLRKQRVFEEIDELLYGAERERAAAGPKRELATVSAAPARASRRK